MPNTPAIPNDPSILTRDLALFAIKSAAIHQKLAPNTDLEADLDVALGRNPPSVAETKLKALFASTMHDWSDWQALVAPQIKRISGLLSQGLDTQSLSNLYGRIDACRHHDVIAIAAEMRQVDAPRLTSRLAVIPPIGASSLTDAVASQTPLADQSQRSAPNSPRSTSQTAPATARAAPEKHRATSAAAPAEPSTAGYDPLPIPPIDHSILSSIDRVVFQATGGAVRNARTLFEKLDEAQRVITSSAFASERPRTLPVPASGAAPSGTMTRISAREPFADAIPASFDTLFDFDIPVYAWDAPHPLVPVKRPGTFQYNPKVLRTILFAISNGYNAALVGPTGCGKTRMLQDIAARLGRPFRRVPIDGEMRKREIIGGFKQISTDKGPETRWFDGILVKAIQEPSIIDIDEIDHSDPDLAYVAHQAYERQGLTILEDEARLIPHHPDCAILATANTKGRDDGESGNLYALRNEMSEATRDRFAYWIECGYMTKEQEAHQLGIDVPALHRDSAEKLVKFANLMRASFLSGKISTTCSYRQTRACAALAVAPPSSDHAQRIAREIDAIHTVLVARAPLRAETAALIELGNQLYGAEWRNP